MYLQMKPAGEPAGRIRVWHKIRLRSLRKAAEMLTDTRYNRADYLKVLRDGLGLTEHSAEYRRFVKVWNDYRGRS